MTPNLTLRARRWLAAGLIALALLPWLGLYVAHTMFSPSKAEWAVMVTATAVITEVAMWIGISWLGLSALRRVSFFASLFGRSGKGQS